LQDYLDRSGVGWTSLDQRLVAQYEKQWRDLYASIFRGRPRVRHGTKAELEYAALEPGPYVIIPFLSNVAGLPVCSDTQPQIAGYACDGRRVPFVSFCSLEFFVSPPDFEWTMIHTHEDYHAYGGPYFVRAEWIP
jgi:hypothetical protein